MRAGRGGKGREEGGEPPEEEEDASGELSAPPAPGVPRCSIRDVPAAGQSCRRLDNGSATSWWVFFLSFFFFFL